MNNKIQALRNLMQNFNIDGYIVASTDEWQNEYAYKKRLEYICGFSGSNGMLIITQNDLILYTDSRYITQATIELSKDYTILNMHQINNCEAMKVCQNTIIGYDSMILTHKHITYYENLAKKYNFKLLPIEENLIDILELEANIVEISSKNAIKLCEKIIAAFPKYFTQYNQEYIDNMKNCTSYAIKIFQRYSGMIAVEFNTSNTNIYWLGISPPDISSLGSKLIKYIEKLSHQNGIKTITATIPYSDNEEFIKRNIYFYKQCGFSEILSFKANNMHDHTSYMVKHVTHYMNITHISNVVVLSYKLTGQTANEKIDYVLNTLPDYDLILTSPESICWLLNLRGNDIQYNTTILSYAILNKHCIILFANLYDDIKFDEITQQKVIIKPLNEFKSFLLQNRNKTFILDKDFAPVWITQNIQNIIHVQDPTLSLRAKKNNVQITGIKLAHIYDGIAICKFWFWLYTSLKSQDKVDEYSAAMQLSKFRQMNEFFVYESFATISAYGSNSAIVHYIPKENICKIIPSPGQEYIYLLDSGGQYSCAGTTDVTRVFDIGKLFGINKYEHKQIFTLVLKGHIAIANAIFPIGTSGGDLDAMARYHLWQQGLDYHHSTGHGLGHFASVHEGIFSIGKHNNIPLEENMVLSIEPGYYKENAFGIRIENIYVIKKSEKFEGYLEFELITMVPIETSLVDFQLLTYHEIDWLKQHNKITFDNIRDFLSQEEIEFVLSNIKVNY